MAVTVEIVHVEGDQTFSEDQLRRSAVQAVQNCLARDYADGFAHDLEDETSIMPVLVRLLDG
jgi:hypothetical protein